MVLFRGNQFNFLSEKPLLRTNKCSEHKKNTTDDPCFYCCQTCKDKENKKYKVFLSDEDLQGKSWFNGKEFFQHFQRFQQTLCFGDICGDGVEDVDQDKEYGDQERHPPRDHVRRN